MAMINRKLTGCSFLAVLLLSATVFGQELQSTDLTGQEISVDQLVGAAIRIAIMSYFQGLATANHIRIADPDIVAVLSARA